MSVRIGEIPIGAPEFDAPALEHKAQRLLGVCHVEEAELSIAFVGADEIAELNGRYRSNPQPTDVLAFPQLEFRQPEAMQQEIAGALLGDVVIALPVAARQARARGHDLDAELQQLLIHGLLHLLGYDHQSNADAERMEARERQLHKALG